MPCGNCVWAPQCIRTHSHRQYTPRLAPREDIIFHKARRGRMYVELLEEHFHWLDMVNFCRRSMLLYTYVNSQVIIEIFHIMWPVQCCFFVFLFLHSLALCVRFVAVFIGRSLDGHYLARAKCNYTELFVEQIRHIMTVVYVYVGLWGLLGCLHLGSTFWMNITYIDVWDYYILGCSKKKCNQRYIMGSCTRYFSKDFSRESFLPANAVLWVHCGQRCNRSDTYVHSLFFFFFFLSLIL